MNTKSGKDNLRKEGKVSYSEKNQTSKQTENLLNELKHNKVETVRIAIDRRTSIELPASLTQEERDERVAVYMRTHNIVIK